MSISYRQFKAPDKKELAELMKSFAAEDPEYRPTSDKKITKTFNELQNHPDRGTLFVIENGNVIVGYSILINFWSNEYGGNVLDIDEIYIKPDCRGKGVGTDFFKYLIKNKINGCVAIELETMPSNSKAMRFYKSLGFKLSPNKHFIYDIQEQ